MSLIDGVAPVVSTTVSMWRSIRCVDSSVIIIVVGRSSESYSPYDPPSLAIHCYSGPPPPYLRMVTSAIGTGIWRTRTVRWTPNDFANPTIQPNPLRWLFAVSVAVGFGLL